MPVGTIVLPLPSNVRKGIGYGALGTEFVGTLGAFTPPPPTAGVANQGVSPQSLILPFQAYLVLITGLPERLVKVWVDPSRPAIEGKDTFVWFRPQMDQPSKSLGPGRWGNRADIRFEVHLLTRNFSDSSQVDIRRIFPFYELYWKMEQSFQGKSLFPTFLAPVIVSGVWHPPEPSGDAAPLSIEPMYLTDLPVPQHGQREEGTLEAGFVVNIPIVLALTVP